MNKKQHLKNKMTSKLFITSLLVLNFSILINGQSLAPTNLTTDMLEHTDRVFLDGYPANFSLWSVMRLSNVTNW